MAPLAVRAIIYFGDLQGAMRHAYRMLQNGSDGHLELPIDG